MTAAIDAHSFGFLDKLEQKSTVEFALKDLVLELDRQCRQPDAWEAEWAARAIGHLRHGLYEAAFDAALTISTPEDERGPISGPAILSRDDIAQAHIASLVTEPKTHPLFR